MFDLLGVLMLGGMAGLIAYEFVQEVRGSSSGLHDRYHE